MPFAILYLTYFVGALLAACVTVAACLSFFDWLNLRNESNL